MTQTTCRKLPVNELWAMKQRTAFHFISSESRLHGGTQSSRYFERGKDWYQQTLQRVLGYLSSVMCEILPFQRLLKNMNDSPYLYISISRNLCLQLTLGLKASLID